VTGDAAAAGDGWAGSAPRAAGMLTKSSIAPATAARAPILTIGSINFLIAAGGPNRQSKERPGPVCRHQIVNIAGMTTVAVPVAVTPLSLHCTVSVTSRGNNPKNLSTARILAVNGPVIWPVSLPMLVISQTGGFGAQGADTLTFTVIGTSLPPGETVDGIALTLAMTTPGFVTVTLVEQVFVLPEASATSQLTGVVPKPKFGPGGVQTGFPTPGSYLTRLD
jgi:hypothetical protein